MMRFILTVLVFLCAWPAQAQTFDLGTFKTIPVLHEGRVKPVDSFARIYLRRFYEDDHIEDLSAAAWLGEVMFTPMEAAKRKSFFIPQRALKRDIGLNEDEKYFSFLDISLALDGSDETLAALMAKDPQTLSEAQRHFLDLHEKRAAYMQLMRSFSLFLPLNIAMPDGNLPVQDGASFIELYKTQPEFMARLKSVVQDKGEDFENYSDEEKALAKIAFDMSLFQSVGAGNDLFRVIPSAQDWISPWQVLFRGEGSIRQSRLMNVWAALVGAYRAGDQSQFSQAAESLHDQPHVAPFETAMTMEGLYNSLQPFNGALALYVFGLLCLIVFAFRPEARLYYAAFSALLAGAFLHLIGVGVRVGLLERAPVGTLYESLVFVALICVIFALISSLYMRAKDLNALRLLLGALSGAGLMIIAPFMIAEGESMEMLVAVLNTNFWLTTHVLTITAGYGFCVLCALMAHGYLIARIKGMETEKLTRIEQGVYRLSLIALLLTAVGTALGGVWADQSWGRFWGWDPKENGALLIVLWLTWIQHGRISGFLKVRTSQALFAYLSVIVATAWFGVNLLSVGLHSYGFINGIAYGLGGFILLETLLIGGLYFWSMKQP